MHHLYNTRALVLNATPEREADVSLILLTEDFGVIRVRAQGLRYEKSKLRYALQKYALANVTLIRGKQGMWRLTTAQAQKSFVKDITTESKKTVARVCRLLEKVVAGELPDQVLFDILIVGLERVLVEREDEDENEKVHGLESIETLLVYRILYALGYIGDTEAGKQFLDDVFDWSDELLFEMKKEQEYLTREINEGLEASHLAR